MIRLTKSLVLLALLTFGGATNAADMLSVSPATISINGSGATVLTLRWRVRVVESAPTTVAITSSSGALAIGGFSGPPLTKLFRHPGTGPIFVTIIERLRIDRTTAKRISQAGTTTYARNFTDNNGASATVFAALQATSGGALSFRNFSLRFDDDSGYRAVAKGSALTARLNLTTNGKGIFAGAWEISGPSSTQGSGFRPIARVRQVLSGSRKTILESPQLPTDRSGIYKVRFMPNSGAFSTAGITYPELTYTVAVGSVAPSLDLLAPKVGSYLTTATQFSWQGVAGATSYRVEFFRAGAGGVGKDRIAALDVRSAPASIRSITLRRLAGHREVYWRILAFDSRGAVIAVSPVRRANGGG